MSNSSFVEKMFSLEGQVALVTGASSGIGAHAAEVLANAGAKVVVLARRKDRLTEVVETIGDSAFAVEADLAAIYADKADFSDLTAEVSTPFGSPTILLNAAGVNMRQHANEVTPEGWRQTIDLNLSVPFFLAQALVPGMVAAGANGKGGSIINFASLQTFRAFENGIAYGASKGGIGQLTRAMAQAWSKSGISANAIAPGFFPTELTAPVFGNDDVSNMHAANTAVGRNGLMSDLSTTLVYLSAPASRYVTGQIIPVEGGYLAT